MKRKLLPVVIVLAALLLSACGKLFYRNEQALEPSTDPVPTVEAPTAQPSAEPATQPTTAPVTEPPTTESTTEPTTEPKDDSYLLRVKNASFYIFARPNYDSDMVQSLPVGTFTIVAEATDDEGNLWGKLKSGLGWVCLTEIRSNTAPVGICVADKALLRSGKYTEYGDSTAEYAIPVAIQAVETLTNVTVSPVDMGPEDTPTGEALLTKTKLKKGSYMVVWLEFPGDLSTFEVSFTDNRGAFRRYRVATSGLHGGLEVWEKT